MTSNEFAEKLYRLNPRIYLGKNINTEYNKDLYSTGIYIRGFNDTGTVDPAEGMSTEELIRLRKDNETPDKYIGWVTVRWIPEGNWYCKDGSILAPGLREILLRLIELKYIKEKRARKVFNLPSLGLSDYDKLSYEQKFEKYWKSQP